MIVSEENPYFQRLEQLLVAKGAIRQVAHGVSPIEEGGGEVLVTGFDGMALVRVQEDLYLLCVGQRGSNSTTGGAKDGYCFPAGFIEMLPIHVNPALDSRQRQWIIDRVARSETIHQFVQKEDRSLQTHEYRLRLKDAHPVTPFLFDTLYRKFYRNPVEALERAFALTEHLSVVEERLLSPLEALEEQALARGVSRRAIWVQAIKQDLPGYEGHALLDDGIFCAFATGWQARLGTAALLARQGQRHLIGGGAIEFSLILVQKARWTIAQRWVLGHITRQMEAEYPPAAALAWYRHYQQVLQDGSWAIPFVYEKIYHRVKKGFPLFPGRKGDPISAQDMLKEAIRLIQRIELV